MFDENGMPQKEQVEVTIPAFRAVSVFDVSQTDGKPIPELEAQNLDVDCIEAPLPPLDLKDRWKAIKEVRLLAQFLI